ncbi:MAG: hypothetical protein B6U97_01660 [Candidatus Altiarchaeales archaeon ex4484_96]|nr:MAG: hypothetical protein B6U97_01660 [Candidatus Altiarchaeales archaeon ex4484_96]
MIPENLSYLDLNYLMLFIIAAFCFISYVWIREGIKRVSLGILEDLLKTFLWIIKWGFLFAVWLFIVEVDYFKISIEPAQKTLIDSFFLAILFMIVTYTASKLKMLSEIYGFKNK